MSDKNVDSSKRLTGCDIVIQTSAGPAWAMGMYVSAADQQWMDEVRHRSYELAIQRGHIRR